MRLTKASGSTLTRPMSRRPMSRDKADTLLLMVACALVLLPHVGHLPLWISAILPALLFWRGWVTFRGNRMPSSWLLLPISILAMGAVYLQFKTFFGRDAGVGMLVMLLTFKLLEMHARRDLFVVVFLSFFLILTNFFYSQSIGTAFIMVLAIVMLLTAQLSFQYTGKVPPLKQRLKLGGMIFGLAVPLTLVLFVLFPRVQGPLWGLPSDAHSARSGMSDSMAPGNITNLAMSDDIAFRVKFIDVAPEKSNLYWRGVVMGRYDGRTWTQLYKQASQTAAPLRTRGKPIRHLITLEPHGRRWLFALEMAHSAPDIGDAASITTEDMQFLAAAPITGRIRYMSSAYTSFDLQANDSISDLQEWLTLPPSYNPRTLAFAADLRRKTNDKAQLVNAVLQHFHEQEFSYTLEPPELGRDSVDDFLFTTRAGFCEHYASAFVVLMRAMDIPARVVTGYQGGEINPVDGFMTVRQSDAHAWAEVWHENRGWIRIDPTAAVAPWRIENNLGSGIKRNAFGGLINMDLTGNTWLSSLKFNWDAVTNSWNQWVLNYSPERQKKLISSLFGFKNVDWQTLTALMFGLGATVMAIVAMPLIMQRRKIHPIDALYLKFCHQMARKGFPRDIHEGPNAYAQRLKLSLAPEKTISAIHFLQLYEIFRYGKVETGSIENLHGKLKSLLALSR